MSGYEFFGKIRDCRWPDLPAIMLTAGHATPKLAVEAIKRRRD